MTEDIGALGAWPSHDDESGDHDAVIANGPLAEVAVNQMAQALGGSDSIEMCVFRANLLRSRFIPEVIAVADALLGFAGERKLLDTALRPLLDWEQPHQTLNQTIAYVRRCHLGSAFLADEGGTFSPLGLHLMNLIANLFAPWVELSQPGVAYDQLISSIPRRLRSSHCTPASAIMLTFLWEEHRGPSLQGDGEKFPWLNVLDLLEPMISDDRLGPAAARIVKSCVTRERFSCDRLANLISSLERSSRPVELLTEMECVRIIQADAPVAWGWRRSLAYFNGRVKRILELLDDLAVQTTRLEAEMLVGYAARIAAYTKLATDFFVSAWQPEEASFALMCFATKPAWSLVEVSDSGAEFELIRQVLGMESRELEFPSVDLLQELVAQDAKRTAAYMVLLACMRARPRVWPGHGAVVAIRLGVRICQTLNSAVLSRAFFPFVNSALALGIASSLEVELSEDIGELNQIANDLVRRSAAIGVYGRASGWSASGE